LSGIFEGNERPEPADRLAKSEKHFIFETLDIDLDVVDALQPRLSDPFVTGRHGQEIRTFLLDVQEFPESKILIASRRGSTRRST